MKENKLMICYSNMFFKIKVKFFLYCFLSFLKKKSIFVRRSKPICEYKKQKIMRIKSILIGILSLITLTTYAQYKKSEKIEDDTTIKKLKIKIATPEELKNFDWNGLKEVFQENDAEQEVTLSLEYENKSESEKSKVKVDNFEIEITVRAADLDQLTKSLEKLSKKLYKLNNRGLKN